jgi:ATP-dependent exoDNAse (exonuclease V) beta subunit
MNRPSDWLEREKARDPGRSCIVQAPAGSGKTELLTQRLLGLLARSEHPEEVVAITFTRKAAAEMRRRIIEALDSAASGDPGEELRPHQQRTRELALAVLSNSEKRGWNLPQHPSRLRIRTIDSLCGELARQLPVLSGLGVGQGVAEDPEPLYRLAAERTMGAVESDNDELQADLSRLLGRYDNQYDRMVELLTAMLGHREQWMRPVIRMRAGDGFDRSAAEDSLRLLVETQLQAAADRLPDFLLRGLPQFLHYALAQSPEDRQALAALLADCAAEGQTTLTLPTTAEALPHWLTLARRLLTKDGKRWRRSVNAHSGFPPPSKAKGEEKRLRQRMKDGYLELVQALEEFEGLRNRLGAVMALPQPGYDDEAWESLESMLRVLLRAAAEWQLLITEVGQADFPEVAERAILALGQDEAPSDLALRMDYRIRHLLVDEFQDTSHKQILLLEQLTAGWSAGDGRTLFLVGDPMQSIYRFRKAEVSLFIDAFEGRLFPHIGLESLQLRVNFRSEQPVLDWVNRVFPTVMPERNDHVMGAVRYTGSDPRPGISGQGSVSTWLTPGKEAEREAGKVTEIIASTDPADSVAILVRSRRHAREILYRLDSLKDQAPRFRYQAIDFNPLGETPLIQDLVSLTLALLQPADRLAWLSVLRAPFCGIGLSDLDRLAGSDRHGIIAETIESMLSRPESSPLSEDGQRRLGRVGPVLLGAASRAGRDALRALVEAAWVRLGGPACAQNRSELEDADTYLDLLQSMASEGQPVDREGLDRRMASLYAQPDASADGKLQVMTVYAAKGLQFDTVILPGLNAGTGGEGGKLLHWFEVPDRDAIVLSPMRNAADRAGLQHSGDLIEFISRIEKQRRALEDGRLLYVAATRARRDLHLLASVETRADGEFRPASGTLLAELWPAIAADAIPQLMEESDPDSRALNGTKPDPCAEGAPDSGENDRQPAQPASFALPQMFRRLAADWEAPQPAAPVPRPRKSFTPASERIEFSWAGESARLTGELVHRLLQLIAEQGMPHWQETGGMAARVGWCRRFLARSGIRGERAELIVARTEEAIGNCLHSERGRWILAPHQDAQCELSLTASIDGQLSTLVLDRSFVFEGSRWIIDYKTSSHAGGDLEGFLRNEAERYAPQLASYRAAVAINEDRPVRTALYFPLLDRFREL